jgi:hypothetical protein
MTLDELDALSKDPEFWERDDWYNIDPNKAPAAAAGDGEAPGSESKAEAAADKAAQPAADPTLPVKEPEPAKAAEPAPRQQEQPPAPTPEEERRIALEAREAARRIEREYVEKYGRTLENPDELARRAKGAQAEHHLREADEEIASAVEHIVERRLEAFQREIMDRFQQGEITAQEALHQTRLMTVHPDYPEIFANQVPLWEWVNSLPKREGDAHEAALSGDDFDAQAKSITAFKAARGITRWSELNTAGAPKGEPPAAPTQTPTAAATPERKVVHAPVNTERLAAAQAIPGEGTQLPLNTPLPRTGMTLDEVDRFVRETWEQA